METSTVRRHQRSPLFFLANISNRSTLDIGVLGYIGIVWPKEHSPEVWSVPPVTLCICCTRGLQIIHIFRRHLQILGPRRLTWYRFWSDLWTSLLTCAFSMVHVNWYTFFCVRGKNCSNYAENIRHHQTKCRHSGSVRPCTILQYFFVHD